MLKTLAPTLLLVLPNSCLLAWGWRRALIALLAGAVTSLALPPAGVLMAPVIGFSCLVWLMDGTVSRPEARRRAVFFSRFRLGWFFGFGYFLASLWWIGSAFLVEAEQFAWMMPFAVLLMPVGLALFTGLGAGIAGLFWRDGWRRILSLAVFLSASDWLRGHILTGFPWNSFGYLVADNLALSQTASVVGLYGLGFLVVLLAALPATLIDSTTRRQAILPTAIACVAVAVLWGAGQVRLTAPVPTAAAEVNIRIVQPSIPQEEKWRPENRQMIFQTLLDLTRAPLGGASVVGLPQIVIWPESALPFLLTREPGALYQIAQALPEHAVLVTGAIRVEAGDGPASFFNSIYVIDTDGTIIDLYDKVRLVPFGEYLPLEPLLTRIGLTALVNAPSAFQPGLTRRPLTTAGDFPSFIPLVCYETIFPGLSRRTGLGAEWLLNVTNDAWFGRTLGPYQHFAKARMRAIEQGLPMVRAANTGISAIIDSKGTAVGRLNLFQSGVVDGVLPGAAPTTPYARLGDIVYGILLFLSALAFFGPRYNRRSRKN
ncbi:apolipoprotein N-acyltransferase [Roseibium aquae]|nr:apolipoprotein N-acyltransferase [Roseibium aquae]